MREYTSPGTVEISPTGNLTDDIVANATDHPDVPCFKRRVDGEWVATTTSEFLAQVRRVAAAIVGHGVDPGDRVALLARTRYEWTLVDYAIWYAGAVTVPIYDTSSADQVQWVLGDSGAKAIFLEGDGRHRDEVVGMLDRLPELSHVWSIDALDSFRPSAPVSEESLDSRRSSVGADSPATIIYTSGTTGRPRGCLLTHGNFMTEITAAVEALHELFEDDDASTLLFLPLAHVFARVIQVGAVRMRVCLGHVAETVHLLEDLESFKPSFMLAVPRVFEKLFNTASLNAAADGKGVAFDRAARTAIAYSRALEKGRPGLALRTRHSFYDRAVYSRLREALGGRCRYAVAGGAPLGERLGHFYRGIGITVLEGYGLTETTGALTVNTPSLLKLGTVGRPLAGTTVRIADDGEILARGDQVFAGYWNRPSNMDGRPDEDGWLCTGDLGEIDDEGFLRVTGRKREILVTAGGKNVAPAPLEAIIRAHPLVDQCMVVGDGEPFVAALITLDPDGLESWSGAPRDLDEAASDEAVRGEVQQAVDEANKTVSQAESVRRFEILPVTWTEDGGHLTPSLKLRREIILRDFRSELEKLFA